MAEERPHGVAANVDFPLVIFGSTNADFSTAAVLTNGDIRLSQDGSTWELLQSTGSAIGINSGYFTISLTSTEMQFARAILLMTDTDATKIFEDQSVLMITKGGSTDAMFAFDLNSTSPNVNIASITAGAITSTAFAAGALNSTAIADDAITAGKIASAALTTDEIAAGVFTKVWAESTRSVTLLGAASITSTAFAAGAINSTAIGTDAITAGKIAAGALTTEEIDSGVFTKIAADVNVEVLDVITVDLFGDPITTTDAPPVSNTLANKQGYLYGTYRNRIDVSTAAKTFYTSTGGIAFTKVISEANSTYTELEASTA